MHHNNSAISAAGRRGFSVAPPLSALPGRADAAAAAGLLGGRSRDRGKESGLRNAGNSCYLNAVLQALLGQRSFVRDLLATASILKGQVTAEQREQAEREEQTRERAEDDARIAEEQGDWSDVESNSAAAARAVSPHVLSETFMQSLLSLVRDMRRSSHGILDAGRLQQLLGRRYTRFAGDDQQDAHEFLSECLTSLDDDILKVMQPTQQHTHNEESKEGGTNNRAGAATAAAASSSVASSPASFSSASSVQLQVDTVSPIYRNFHSEIEQRLECASCGYARVKSEHFNELSLDLPEELRRAAGAPSPTPDRAAAAPSPSAARDTPEPSSPNSSPQSPTENARPRRLGRNANVHSEGTAALTGARTTVSPAPAPECPKHHRAMAPVKDTATAAAAAAAASSGLVLFKCPAQRCKQTASLPAEPVARSPAPLPASSSTQSLNSALAKLTPASAAANATAASSSSAATAAHASSSSVRRPGKGGPTGPIASLSDLLSRFFSSQLIEYRCERCSGTVCKKSYAFKQLPRVLILHLKRFLPNYRLGTYEKRTDRVRVDEAIDLGFACTTQTRKPMPVQDVATPSTSTAGGRGSPKPAAAAATNAFSALFASSSAAACKCGASADQCTHAHGIHTSPEDIAAFIAAQHEPAASGAADGDSGARSPSSRAGGKLKRKSGQLASVDAGADSADSSNSGAANRKKTRNTRSSPSPSPSPVMDDDSYFASSSAESAAAQMVSARINNLHAEIRHLQQQLSDVSRAPALSSSFSSGAAAGFVPVPAVAALSDRKREALLQQHVLRLSVLEAELKTQMDVQASLSMQKTMRTRSNPAHSTAASASSFSPVPPPPQGSLPAALGPSIVPVYELQAVIHHRGSIATSGHYLTDLKSDMPPAAGGGACTTGWRRFDDQYVRAIDSTQAMSYGESAGYIFFFSYQPLLNLESMQQQQRLQQSANGNTTTAASSSSSSSSSAAAASSGSASPSHTPMRL